MDSSTASDLPGQRPLYYWLTCSGLAVPPSTRTVLPSEPKYGGSRAVTVNFACAAGVFGEAVIVSSPIRRSASQLASAGRAAATSPVRTSPRSEGASAITVRDESRLPGRRGGRSRGSRPTRPSGGRTGVARPHRAPDLHERVTVEDGEAVGEALGVSEFVGDEDGRHPSLGDQGPHRGRRREKRDTSLRTSARLGAVVGVDL